MPTNEELQGLLNAEQLEANIRSKQAKIDEYRRGVNYLRNTSDPHNPYTLGRIAHLESIILDYEEAISTWKALLDTITESTEKGPE